ncbi:hypothetical protein CSA08_04675 [Candidatus Gracilibacteria bacterium]|nr:MAG: hypothetical protein CSA08_04675 [Candidatus Gracilibacteria bacterium]
MLVDNEVIEFENKLKELFAELGIAEVRINYRTGCTINTIKECMKQDIYAANKNYYEAHKKEIEEEFKKYKPIIDLKLKELFNKSSIGKLKRISLKIKEIRWNHSGIMWKIYNYILDEVEKEISRREILLTKELIQGYADDGLDVSGLKSIGEGLGALAAYWKGYIKDDPYLMSQVDLKKDLKAVSYELDPRKKVKKLRKLGNKIVKLNKKKGTTIKKGKKKKGTDTKELKIPGDYKQQITERMDHVMKPEFHTSGKYYGLHSLNKLPKSKYDIEVKGVFPDRKNKPYRAEVLVEGPDGKTYFKKGSSTTSFFPDSWDEKRIQKEVEYAMENNKGLVNDKKPTEGIWGKSRDGTFNIQIQMDPKTGKVSSFFPTFNPNLK